jgi:hypothetical protein
MLSPNATEFLPTSSAILSEEGVLAETRMCLLLESTPMSNREVVPGLCLSQREIEKTGEDSGNFFVGRADRFR